MTLYFSQETSASVTIVDGVTSLLLILIIIFGLPGNVIVIAAIWSNERLCFRQNVLHVSLAVANCIACGISAPLLLCWVMNSSQVDSTICTLQELTLTLGEHINVLTVCIITAIRVLTIIKQWSFLWSLTSLVSILFITWSSGILFTIYEVVVHNSAMYWYCMNSEKLYYLEHQANNFILLPSITVFILFNIILYFLAFRKLAQNKIKIHPYPVKSNVGKQGLYQDSSLSSSWTDSQTLLYMFYEAEETSLKTTLILSTTLVCSYIPHVVITIIKIVHGPHTISPSIYGFAIAFIYIQNALNPYIYTLQSHSFYQQLQEWCALIMRKREKIYNVPEKCSPI